MDLSGMKKQMKMDDIIIHICCSIISPVTTDSCCSFDKRCTCISWLKGREKAGQSEVTSIISNVDVSRRLQQAGLPSYFLIASGQAGLYLHNRVTTTKIIKTSHLIVIAICLLVHFCEPLAVQVVPQPFLFGYFFFSSVSKKRFFLFHHWLSMFP